MVEEAFIQVYTKFKLHFYRSLFEKIQSRETSLTTVETYCIEIIHAMGTPTIGEFASFIQISSPNAAYKVNSLIKKGYLRKVQSEDDKREYYLEVTDKYYNYYNINAVYIKKVAARMKERFTEEEMKMIDRLLSIMSNELMPEVENIKSELISAEE